MLSNMSGKKCFPYRLPKTVFLTLSERKKIRFPYYTRRLLFEKQYTSDIYYMSRPMTIYVMQGST